MTRPPNTTTADTTAIDANTVCLRPQATDDSYVQNLAALWAIDPTLAAAIDALDDDAWLQLEPARSGELTIAAPDAAGRPVYLHSRHQPGTEADRLIATVNTADRAVFVVHGLGAGHHVAALWSSLNDDAVVFVFEPDVRVVNAWLRVSSCVQMLRSRRLKIITAIDKAAWFELLTPHLAGVSLGIEIVTHEPSVRRSPDFFAGAKQITEEFAAFARTTLNTLLVNGRRTSENLARNVGHYVSTRGVDALKDSYLSKPAIVVSAGPSLRKNKHLLIEAQKHAVIIAVQTTLKPLLEIGVTPDFVTSLDYHDICTRFFDNLPPGVTTRLVAEPKASPAVLALSPGPLTLLGNDFIERLLREISPRKAQLRAGATVAHLAFYLAEHLGCGPIIFVGQDLGFSDGLCYTPGTSYDDVWRPEFGRFCTPEMKQWEQIARDRAILRQIPDHAGRPMYTEERLYTYLQQFERDFLASDRLILDATEGGAAKHGASSVTLAEALAEHCAKPIKKHSGSTNDSPPHDTESARTCLMRRREEAEELAKLSRQSLAILHRIAERPTDVVHVNREIARLDSLRGQVDALGATYDLVTNLSQATELARYKADRLTKRRGLDGASKQAAQLARDIANVAAVIAAAEDFSKLMDDALAHITPRQPSVPLRRAA